MRPRFLLLPLFAAAFAAAPAAAGPLYANDFATRRSSDATPSGRWMEADYVTGALVRAVDSVDANSPYNTATEYQDAWTMKNGYAHSAVQFKVAADGGNQGALVNVKSGGTLQSSATIAMQPFYNEFTNGHLKISVDIRTPALTNSFKPSGRSYYRRCKNRI